MVRQVLRGQVRGEGVTGVMLLLPTRSSDIADGGLGWRADEALVTSDRGGTETLLVPVGEADDVSSMRGVCQSQCVCVCVCVCERACR